MKVLFIGNSHTYFNDMPHLFSTMCESGAGTAADVTMLAYSGRTLAWHEKEYFSVRFNLLYGNYDYCVIQQAAHPFPAEAETIPYATQMIDLCRSVGTTPVLFMTWAEKRKPENQQRMIDTYTKLAAETGALLAPIGCIWQEVRVRYPEIELYYADEAHASVYGDYLIAATFFAVIAGGDVLQLDASALDFTKNKTLDFESPRILEQKSNIVCTLNTASCQKICETIKLFMSGAQ